MNNILAYMQWLSTGVPTGTSVKGRGFGPLDQKLKANKAHGKEVYAAKCASCHGATGAGTKSPACSYLFPPVAGKDSFDGAGMARTYTAAAFVNHNMPLGQGGSLSDQEALDVAEYFTHLPRPAYQFKARDWPRATNRTTCVTDVAPPGAHRRQQCCAAASLSDYRLPILKVAFGNF